MINLVVVIAIILDEWFAQIGTTKWTNKNHCNPISKAPYSDDGICRKSVAQTAFPLPLAFNKKKREEKECDAHAQTSIQIYE